MIGTILKNMRLSAGFSQKELGKKLNLADTTISSYERENSQPDFDTILRISKLCHFDIFFQNKDHTTFSVEQLSKEQDF